MTAQFFKMKNLAVNICYYAKLHKAFSFRYGGHVSIALLHRVSQKHSDEINPLNFLSVSQEHLERYILKKKKEGWNFISIDELFNNFDHLTRSGRHMLITLDDGYRDNYTCGYPIFKKHNIPFIIYVSNSFPEKKADLWWEVLANIALRKNIIKLPSNESDIELASSSVSIRYKLLCRYLSSIDAQSQIDFIDRLIRQYKIEPTSGSELLSWDEIRDMAIDPLCTIGAHTLSHRNLSTLNDKEARNEIAVSKIELEQKTGKPVLHFAYPYGKTRQITERDVNLVRETGFLTAVTTNIGNVFPEHKNFLHLLPRFPLYEGKTLGKISEIYLTGMHGAITRHLRRVVTL